MKMAGGNQYNRDNPNSLRESICAMMQPGARVLGCGQIVSIVSKVETDAKFWQRNVVIAMPLVLLAEHLKKYQDFLGRNYKRVLKALQSQNKTWEQIYQGICTAIAAGVICDTRPFKMLQKCMRYISQALCVCSNELPQELQNLLDVGPTSSFRCASSPRGRALETVLPAHFSAAHRCVINAVSWACAARLATLLGVPARVRWPSKPGWKQILAASEGVAKTFGIELHIDTSLAEGDFELQLLQMWMLVSVSGNERSLSQQLRKRKAAELCAATPPRNSAAESTHLCNRAKIARCITTH